MNCRENTQKGILIPNPFILLFLRLFRSASKETFRGKFGMDKQRNAIHCGETFQSAESEIDMVFGKNGFSKGVQQT